MDARRRVGSEGEDAAVAYLVRRGWQLIERNVRYRDGELDLICVKDGVLAIVEVKTRRSIRAGTGAEAVTFQKQARIRRLAMRWLSERKPGAKQIRFDVMELRYRDGAYLVRHLEGAF